MMDMSLTIFVKEYYRPPHIRHNLLGDERFGFQIQCYKAKQNNLLQLKGEREILCL
jgi:hypothetical protein